MAAGDLITAEWQVEWRGMLLGEPGPVRLTALSGWLSRPPMRTSVSDRPGRHGARPGQQRAGSRIVEASLLASLDEVAATALREVCWVDEDPVEEPLVIWAGTGAPQRVMARIVRCDIPTDAEFAAGHKRAVIQWQATDARRYSLAEHTSMVGLPVPPGGGLEFPLEFPLDFGLGRTAGRVTCANAGDCATWPTLTVTGPVTGPIIRELGGAGLLRFAPTLAVASGQQMVIDTDARTVTVAGVSRRDQFVVADWFALPRRATTQIGFDSTGTYSPAARLAVTWRDAWM